MAIINLKHYYYPIYTKDTFLEVPDDVAAALEEGRLIENRQDHKRHYYHVYSMESSPGIENHAEFLVMSPEELMIQEEDEAAAELMLERLEKAMFLLTPIQARRVYARFVLKKKFRQIAEDEGIRNSCASESVNRAIRKLRKHFAKNGWLKRG